MQTDSFTAAQLRAVSSDHDQILTLAGPGSGKTTVLVARIKRLMMEGVPATSICAFTYTNAAARNIEKRLTIFPEPASPHLPNTHRVIPVTLGYAGTLHGFCLRMLRTYGTAHGYGPRTAVIDEETSNELLKIKAEAMGYKDPIKAVHDLKRVGRPMRGIGISYTRAQLVLVAYMDELNQAGLVDFDLILTEFFRLMRIDRPFRANVGALFSHLLVDEVQDMAAIDWNIVEEFPVPNRFLVGDTDQGIFAFRGGCLARAMRFAADPDVEVIRLEENFRSDASICFSANRLIRWNTNRVDKKTVPISGENGMVLRCSPAAMDAHEIEIVLKFLSHHGNPSEVAVLARHNAVADNFRAAIQAAGFPVEEPEREGNPPDWAHARALFEFAAQPNNDTLASLLMIVRAVRAGSSLLDARAKVTGILQECRAKGQTLNERWLGFNPPQAYSKITALLLAEKETLTLESQIALGAIIDALPDNATMADVALEVARRKAPQPERKGGVAVTTLHSAKGREWDTVFLVGCEEEIFIGKKDVVEEIEEARRLFYVGLTRARHTVFISYAESRRAAWGSKPYEQHRPVRFIAEAMGEVSP